MKKGTDRIMIGLLALLMVTGSIAQKPVTISSLRLIGEKEIENGFSFKGTSVGGLSSIDYDSRRAVYYMVCDDRSAINPARFYTAKIFFTAKAIDSVVMVGVDTLLQPDGSVYPNAKQDPARTPDPEAMRYDPLRKRLIWSSEGERLVRGKDTVLQNPSINIISLQGRYRDSFRLPANLYMRATEKGPRQNGVLEGMSFDRNYQTLYVNVEEPLYEDGPRADLTDNQAWIRIYRFDVRTRKNTAQYAYRLDPVAYPASPANAFMVNGVPDILALGGNKMIVMERSFSTGRLPCTIKLYLTDLGKAGDIRLNLSLRKTPPAKPVTKKLLLNMDSLGIYVDNVEGMTLGPRLPNGHQTLVLVADNNFNAFEKTQIFVFEIIP
jgi:hypothetical protein